MNDYSIRTSRSTS